MGRLQRLAAFPPDAIVQLFPGADHPETGVDALIQIRACADVPASDKTVILVHHMIQINR